VQGEYLGKAKHIFSHVEWHMIGYRVESEKDERYAWETPEAIRDRYAIPKAFHAFLKKI
jgi:A/G-specific adenine glycosylase